MRSGAGPLQSAALRETAPDSSPRGGAKAEGKACGAGSESTLIEEDRGERTAFGGDLIRRYAPALPDAGRAKEMGKA